MFSELKQVLDRYIYSTKDMTELNLLLVKMLSHGDDPKQIIDVMAGFIRKHDLDETAEKELYGLIALMGGECSPDKAVESDQFDAFSETNSWMSYHH
ncbi:hypothetical protein [Vibrio quintilis]|uniref:Uncharacterized protein n=1 Tax=Vibrio quintilis TaxID=1117707 RepID=A0A1M7YR42_9VIBR|nr:hypothetical protein [Vibrio quintilis]SHO55103.1 hypothetical protein VQ7734_00822 [Vibrio quintilis]